MIIYRKLNPEKNSFAIDFSSPTLRLAKIERKKYLDVVALSEVNYNNRIFYNNKVEDEDALASNIKHLISNIEGEKIKTKFVSLAVHEEKAFIKVIKVPKLSKKELSSAILYEAENHLPLPIEEAYFDYKIINSFSGSDRSYQQILIAAAPKIIIDPYISSVEKAGLSPVNVEINVFSLLRLVAKEYIQDKPALLIKITPEKITYILCTSQVIWFTSSSSPSEDEKNHEDILQANLLTEIEKYIKYFEKRIREEWGIEMGVSKVVFCNDNFNMRCNTEDLRKRIGVDVEIVQDLPKIKSSLSGFNDRKYHFATVLGLALKYFTEEND